MDWSCRSIVPIVSPGSLVEVRARHMSFNSLVQVCVAMIRIVWTLDPMGTIGIVFISRKWVAWIASIDMMLICSTWVASRDLMLVCGTWVAWVNLILV
jgi:hypothetical protein